MGENYLDHPLYHCAGYYPFIDGKQEAALSLYKGSKVEILESNGMTVEEGKSAFKFLFEKVQDSKGYEAVKKLRNFVKTKLYDNQHNIMFLEKEDVADPNPVHERQRLDFLIYQRSL